MSSNLKRKFYYVYILLSLKDRTFYTGITSDLKTRFDHHNSGYTRSTKFKRPLDLVYYEAYRVRQDALDREKYLKTYNGRIYLRKRIKSYLTG